MEFLKKLAGTFYAPPVYNGIARDEQGIGARYILLTTAAMLAVVMITVFKSGIFDIGFKKLPAVMQTFPVVTIRDSKLSIDKPVPYTITLPETEVKAVVDTNYHMQDLATLATKMEREKIVVLVTESAFITRTQDGELRVKDFAGMKLGDGVITHETWDKLADMLATWGLPVLVTFIIVFSGAAIFLYGLIATFMSAVVVSLLSAILRTNLAFDAAMRLAAAARVPVTVITLLPFVSVGLSWGIWLAYIVFATWSTRMKGGAAPA